MPAGQFSSRFTQIKQSIHAYPATHEEETDPQRKQADHPQQGAKQIDKKRQHGRIVKLIVVNRNRIGGIILFSDASKMRPLAEDCCKLKNILIVRPYDASVTHANTLITLIQM